MLLEVFLYDEAAHGMSNEHRLGIEHIDDGADIVDIVGDGTRVRRLGKGAVTMAAQAEGDSRETLGDEEIQEQLVLTPYGVPRPVDE